MFEEKAEAVAAEVQEEYQALCSTLPGKKSVLRQTSAADLKTFQFSKVVDKLSVRAPAFSSILEASVKRYRNQHTRNEIIPSIGFAAAILLHIVSPGSCLKNGVSVYSCIVRFLNDNNIK